MTDTSREAIGPACSVIWESKAGQVVRLKATRLIRALASERDTLQARVAELEAAQQKLEVENKRLRDALSPFLEAADEADELGYDDENQAPVGCGQCRAARAALGDA